MRVCAVAVIGWQGEVDKSRRAIQRELTATALDRSTSLLAATTGVLADGCSCAIGVTAMATGEGGVSGVLSSVRWGQTSQAGL